MNIELYKPFVHDEEKECYITWVIEHETEHAILLTARYTRGSVIVTEKSYWFVKRAIQIDGKRPDSTINLEGWKNAKTIHIPDWMWGKRKEAGPMGCFCRRGT